MYRWNPESNTVTDTLGKEYAVGDLVVYATTSCRSPVLKLATVEKIYTRPNPYTGKKELRVGVKEISNARNFKRYDATNIRTTYPFVANIVKYSEG